jgi:hypothetical protein
LLRGFIVWIAWIDGNACSFNNDNWPAGKTQQLIWDAVDELGRAAWMRTLDLCKQNPQRCVQYLNNFDKTWMQTKFFGSRVDMQVTWSTSRPSLGSFSEWLFCSGTCLSCWGLSLFVGALAGWLVAAGPWFSGSGVSCFCGSLLPSAFGAGFFGREHFVLLRRRVISPWFCGVVLQVSLGI